MRVRARARARACVKGARGGRRRSAVSRGGVARLSCMTKIPTARKDGRHTFAPLTLASVGEDGGFTTRLAEDSPSTERYPDCRPPEERSALDAQEKAYYALGGQDVDADHAAWLRFRAQRFPRPA